MPADPGSARSALATARFFTQQAQAEMPALQQESVGLQRILLSVIESRAASATSETEVPQLSLENEAAHIALEAFKHYLEAAIVFGRTVTFRLQAEYGHLPSFEPWYSQQRNLMNHDPLFKFFRDERNLVLKQREVSISRSISVSVERSETVSTSTRSGARGFSASASMSAGWSDSIFFEDPDWEDRQALSLVTDYLDRLEATVDDALSHFE